MRVHFTHKKESRFISAEYDCIDLLDARPVLLDYQQPWASLFVTQAHRCGSRLSGELAKAVGRATNGWRDADGYLAAGGHTTKILRDGDGLLLRAPEPIVLMAAGVVQALGAVPSVVCDHVGVAARRRSPSCRVLLMARNFVIAEAFRFVLLK